MSCDARFKVRRYLSRLGVQPDKPINWRLTTSYHVKLEIGQPCIYGIADPRDHVIRYVGFTRSEMSYRLRRHMQDPSNVGMATWLRRLESEHVRPEIVALEAIWKNSDWAKAEKKWISRLRVMGALLNVESGGKSSWKGRRCDYQVAGGPVRVLSRDEVARLNERTLANSCDGVQAERKTGT